MLLLYFTLKPFTIKVLLLVCLMAVEVRYRPWLLNMWWWWWGGKASSGSHTYLLPSHVDQQLCAIGAEGHIGGNQHSQTVIVIRQLHWQVTCGETA